jgi:hypothetical protein
VAPEPKQLPIPGIEPSLEISFIEISFDILQEPDTLGYKRDI